MKVCPRVLYAHARTIAIGEAQHARRDAVHAVVEAMVTLGCYLVNGINVWGIERMILAHRKFMRPPVDLTRSGKNDPNCRVLAPDRFQKVKLGHHIRVRSLSGSLINPHD